MMIIYKNIKCLVPSISLISKVSFYFQLHQLQQLRFFVCKQQELTLMNLGRTEMYENRKAYRKSWNKYQPVIYLFLKEN